MTGKAARPDQDRWLTTEEVAERLHIEPQTVRFWRSKGVAPKGTKIGRRVLFRLSDVIAWEYQQEAAGGA